jgi:hypothetical protein
MQYRDDGEREAVRDCGEEDVPVGIEAGSDDGAYDVDEPCEGSPDRGLPESLALATLYV